MKLLKLNLLAIYIEMYIQCFCSVETKLVRKIKQVTLVFLTKLTGLPESCQNAYKLYSPITKAFYITK